MIVLDEFIKKWDNKAIDFDGVYGPQCMDLMHQYHVEVLGIADGRTLAAPAAKDVYLQFDKMFNNNLFEKFPNTPIGVPQKGDIVLWGTGIGPYGHVAIFIEGDVNRFKSFDQNFPTGSKCKIVEHTYTGVLGWLRAKPQEQMVTLPQKELDAIRIRRDELYQLSEVQKTTITNLNKTIKEKEQTLKDKDIELSTQGSELLKLMGERDSLQKQLDSLSEDVKQLDQCKWDRKNCLEAQETQNKKIAQLEKTSYTTAPTSVLIRQIIENTLESFIKKP